MEEEDARDLDGGLWCGGEGEWGVFVEPGVLGCEVSEFEVVEVVASGAAWSVGGGGGGGAGAGGASGSGGGMMVTVLSWQS